MVVLILPVDAKAAKLRRSLRLSPHSEKNMKCCEKEDPAKVDSSQTTKTRAICLRKLVYFTLLIKP